MDKKRRRDLREKNLRVWAGEKDLFPVSASVDSSLKKNTAFIKRLRTAITASTAATFLQEIRTLSLHKYLSEIISASYEGLCRLKSPGEIAAVIEIISALHQRFGPEEFTRYLGWYLGRGLSSPEKSQLKALTPDAREKEEKERLARHRVLLRIATELWLVGVIRSLDDVSRPDDGGKGKETSGTIGSKADGLSRGKYGSENVRSAKEANIEPFPLEVLKDLLGHDREHINLPIVVLFVKSFGWDILGVKNTPSEGRKTVEEDGATTGAQREGEEEVEVNGVSNDDPPLISTDLQQRFRNVLMRYCEDVIAHLVRDQKAITAQGRRNAEAYVKSGEVFEDRQANYDKQLKAQEKLVSNAQVLCDAVGCQMPNLKEEEAANTSSDGSIGLVKTGEYLRSQTEGAGIWEDEDERRFYENLIDLKDRVPGILLEDGKKKKQDGDTQVGKKSDEKMEDQKPDQPALPEASESSDSKAIDSEDQSTVIANKTVGAQVDAILARLPELTNKDAVDQAAIDFCFLNSKASRNRLLKAVQDVPKGRSDLFPLYSRLIATLGRYLPDLLQGLVSYLDDEFRSLQRRKQKDFLGQVRTGNVRYLAELTKFGAVPEHVIFHCLKVGLDDFSRMNIEIICNLLENCGRYLLRNPETSPRMASFLETLQRKKSAQHLGQQERMLIENAMYYVNPPDRTAIQQKERSPVELFVRKLLYLDMNKRNYTRILKQIRKLHWEEEEVAVMLEKTFSKPGKVKYSNIHLLAILAGALNRYHQEFVITVIDNILEQITTGLEQNDFRFNQRRIAEVKYLGELYNYKMVDSPVIFDTLYRIVTFGHEAGTPTPGRYCLLDPPDDYFRIRLVSSLLETCGMCFDRGAAKKKLDFFLTFFQYYIHTKDSVPMDIDFIIQDIFALVRPHWKLATDLEEAGNTFADAVKQNYQTSALDKAAEADEPEDDSSTDGAIDDDDGPAPELEESESSDEEVEVGGEANQLDSEEEEDIVVTRQEEERDPEAEAEFDRELAKMMSESIESRKFDRKPLFDVPLPMRRATRDAAAGGEETFEDGAASPSTTMAFSLLTKRGNRQQTRTVDLPSDSTFAVAMKSKQQAEREEQQRIKNLVLNYDLRDENDNDGIEKHSASHTPTTKLDKASNNRNTQRARKLQLSDVDW